MKKKMRHLILVWSVYGCVCVFAHRRIPNGKYVWEIFSVGSASYAPLPPSRISVVYLLVLSLIRCYTVFASNFSRRFLRMFTFRPMHPRCLAVWLVLCSYQLIKERVHWNTLCHHILSLFFSSFIIAFDTNAFQRCNFYARSDPKMENAN